MLDEARHWAETQFGTADLGDARRTHRLVSIMAAIARAPDESLPRQLGSLANTKAGYRLFDCGAVARTAVMDPHVAHCRAEAARHPMARPGRELGIVHGPQLTRQRLLGDRDAELLPDPCDQIDQPPAHHAVDRRNGPLL